MEVECNLCRQLPICDMAELITQSDIIDDICITTYQTDRFDDTLLSLSVIAKTFLSLLFIGWLLTVKKLCFAFVSEFTDFSSQPFPLHFFCKT